MHDDSVFRFDRILIPDAHLIWSHWVSSIISNVHNFDCTHVHVCSSPYFMFQIELGNSYKLQAIHHVMSVSAPSSFLLG